MDVAGSAAIAPASRRTQGMTAPKLRMCVGSKRFGIEPHEAPPEDFPHHPSQKDGIGRMCKPHWNIYTTGLARDAKPAR
jgi:hypothetical protein